MWNFIAGFIVGTVLVGAATMEVLGYPRPRKKTKANLSDEEEAIRE